MNTDYYKSEHQKILEIVSQISELIKEIEQNTVNIVSLIQQMNTLFKIHLAKESKILFPYLLSFENVDNQDTINKFQYDCREILDSWELFVIKWNNPKKIIQNITQFENDWLNITSSVSSRLEDEEALLYPICESYGLRR